MTYFTIVLEEAVCEEVLIRRLQMQQRSSHPFLAESDVPHGGPRFAENHLRGSRRYF